MSAGAAAAAAAAAAYIQAVRASGVLVRVEPNVFLTLVQKQTGPLVVQSSGGFFRTSYHYLTTYKGLAFYTKSPEPLNLPPGSEIVQAGALWVPG